MKHNSKQFLALFMAASMAVAPVSGVYAEDQNAAVENTLSENKQDNDEAGQTEPEAAAGQTESEAAAGQTETKDKTKSGDADIPKTGDRSDIMVWSTLLGVSFAGFAGVIYKKKKERI